MGDGAAKSGAEHAYAGLYCSKLPKKKRIAAGVDRVFNQLWARLRQPETSELVSGLKRCVCRSRLESLSPSAPWAESQISLLRDFDTQRAQTARRHGHAWRWSGRQWEDVDGKWADDGDVGDGDPSRQRHEYAATGLRAEGSRRQRCTGHFLAKFGIDSVETAVVRTTGGSVRRVQHRYQSLQSPNYMSGALCLYGRE
jgi:hypothetical protein